MTSTVAGNLMTVDQRIRKACELAGRDRTTVTLVAVTKFQSAEAIQALAAAGAQHFGESRVQEAIMKVPRLKSLGTWHFIGHLQTNKAAQAVELFNIIQSVDSLRLAQKLDAAAAEQGKTLEVFAQVNISHEAQKHGFADTGAEAELVAMAALPHLRLKGLMGMAAPHPDPMDARVDFARLGALRQRLQAHLGPLALSMGMSQDLEAAILEGADYVRVGTALFEGLPPTPPLNAMP